MSQRPPTSELRERGEEGEEERVYRVFVAPSPSYLADTRASSPPPPSSSSFSSAGGSSPYSGVSFSYIVPGGAAVPSIAAHDVGAVGAAAGDRAGGRGRAERVYVIVINAVDSIRALEVCVRVRVSACLFRSICRATQLNQ